MDKVAPRQQAATTLTKREREVMDRIALGLTSKEIAHELHVAVRTIQTFRERLMRKLDIHNKAQLVQYAIQKKIIKIPNLVP